MTALSSFRTAAHEKNPGLPLLLDDGTNVLLQSTQMLDDESLRQTVESQKLLDKLNDAEDADPVRIRAILVDLLSGVSTDRKKTSAALDKEPLGVLVQIANAYGEANGDAPKSEGDTGAVGGA